MPAEMTPRERVLTALRRQTPDRVPKSFGWTPPVADLLRTRLGDVDPYDHFGVETRPVGPVPTREPGEFSRYFADIFTPIPAMISLHEEIRRRPLPTYIFSNTNELSARHIRQAFLFYNLFTGHVLSYEHRAMKPDPALYEVLERLAGLDGPNLLYVDDRPENIETGRQRGWQTVWYEDPDQTRARFRQAGVVP